jgi:hypothetical protein
VPSEQDDTPALGDRSLPVCPAHSSTYKHRRAPPTEERARRYESLAARGRHHSRHKLCRRLGFLGGEPTVT